MANLPTISLTDANLTEGDSGSKTLKFIVKLSEAASQAVTFTASTLDGTAIGGNDYQPLSGQLFTIPAGQTQLEIPVAILGDKQSELDESFSLVLSKANNAVFDGDLATLTATATIRNDDLPIIRMDDVRITEGEVGLRDADVVVTLSSPAPVDVKLHFQTLDGVAKAGLDYLETHGDLTIPKGASEGHIKVSILGDTSPEATENFSVQLSQPQGAAFLDAATTLSNTVSIVTDDAAKLPTLQVKANPVDEGDSDTSALKVVFTLSSTPANEARLHFATQDGEAVAGSDYKTQSGDVVFLAGQQEASVTLSVLSDTEREDNESFILHLSAPQGLQLVEGLPTQDVILTILDDEPAIVPSKLDGTPGDDKDDLLDATKKDTEGLGDDFIDGKKGADLMVGGEGNDTYVVDNVKDSIIEQDQSEDGVSGDHDQVLSSAPSYTLPANVEDLTITGTAKGDATGNGLNNRMTGNGGVNKLLGKDGDDVIDGNFGKDTFEGGNGNDVFVFSTGIKGDRNVDTIKDFTVDSDRLYLSSDVFGLLAETLGYSEGDEAIALDDTHFIAAPKALSLKLDDGEPVILYDTKTGRLYYDEDGNGAQKPAWFAALTNKPASLSATDFVLGDSQAIDGLLGDSSTTEDNTPPAINHAPVANNDNYQNLPTAQSVSHSFAELLANDSDPDKDPLTITTATATAGGVTSLVNGKVVFNPFSGVLSGGYQYTVSDGKGGTASAQVKLSFTPPNHPPSPKDDSFTGLPANQAVSKTFADLLKNDTDPDANDTLTIIGAGQAVGGSLSFNKDAGQIVFTPTPGVAQGGYQYTVADTLGDSNNANVNLTFINRAPSAVDDEFKRLPANQSVSKSIAELTANDSDPEGDALTITAVTPLDAGGVKLENGKVVYTPISDATSGRFQYTLSDGHDNSDQGEVKLSFVLPNKPPKAVDDSYSNLPSNQPVSKTTADLLANDSDPDGGTLSLTQVDSEKGGRVNLNKETGQITFTPNNGETSGAFQYTISDGQGGSSTASVKLDFLKPNQQPNAENDAFTDKPINQAVVLTAQDLLKNDSDPDKNDTLTISAVNPKSGGGVTLNNGAITLTPTSGATSASFEYTISDGHGGSDTAQVSISFVNNNKAPTPQNDSFSGKPLNQTVTLTSQDLLANDSDPDKDSLTLTTVSNPTNGKVNLNNGTITFTPDKDITSGSFQYTVSDGKDHSANATITLGFVAPQQNTVTALPSDNRTYESTLSLTENGDNMQGNSAPEKFLGQGGNDTLMGRDGNDHLDGGIGADKLYGDNGDDYLLGGEGDDSIYGSEGNDSIDGGAGNNTLDGESGNDLLFSGNGNDNVKGGDGNDQINAGEGNDNVEGGNGNDQIDAGNGTNKIYGNDGKDTIASGSGNDVIVGGAGSDEISAGSGNDKVVVSTNDITQGYGHDLIKGEEGNDTLEGGAGSDTIYGGSGDDWLYGDLDSDSLTKRYNHDDKNSESGYGADLIYGGEGNDTIVDMKRDSNSQLDSPKFYGEAGNDKITAYGWLIGGDGDDVLKGFWYLVGGSGNDTLTGAMAGDGETFQGDAGVDVITTNTGEDKVRYVTPSDSGIGVGNRDIITDFDNGSADVIDLWRLLATPLSFINQDAFSNQAGQVRYTIETPNARTIVAIDLTGDAVADMEIELTGLKTLEAGDFILSKPA